MKIAYISIAQFASAVLYAIMSGNDKAPFLVILSLGIAIICSIMGAIVGQFKAAMAALFPLVYTAIIVMLSRLGFVDLYYFLGFS